MKRLKIILKSDYYIWLIFIFSLLFTLVVINSNTKSKYNGNETKLYGYIQDYKIKDDKITIHLKAKENIIVNYHFNDENEIKKYTYGDYILIKGNLQIPNDNTNFNLFNYRKYLLSKKIKYLFKADDIYLVKKTNNIFYKLKVILLKRINKCVKSKGYIKTFLFADKNNIDEEIYDKYQKLGISHLLAVSGMHTSLITLIIFKMLSFLKGNKKYLIVSIILLIYLFLTNFTVSMIRSCFQFILFWVNKVFKLNIKNTNIVIFIFSILLIYNPYYIYNMGFIFSFLISFTLIKYSFLLNDDNKIKSLVLISIISFLVSIPILINNFYQINLFSIIFNIFYVPFVSYILFPINLITLIFPFLDNINYVFISIFENISDILSNIDILTFSFAKIPLILVILYYIVLFNILNKVNLKKIILLICLLITFYLYKSYLFIPKITFIDIGQGDSTLIRLKKNNILIDTGGRVSFNNHIYNLTNNILLPYFKSEGGKKIDYLIITHGDYDHMGEAVNLVNSFKVEKVIFNCGPYNDLEKELIKVLDKKKIKYYSCIKELNIDNNKLYFLQTKVYELYR